MVLNNNSASLPERREIYKKFIQRSKSTLSQSCFGIDVATSYSP